MVLYLQLVPAAFFPLSYGATRYGWVGIFLLLLWLDEISVVHLCLAWHARVQFLRRQCRNLIYCMYRVLCGNVCFNMEEVGLDTGNAESTNAKLRTWRAGPLHVQHVIVLG